jgi:hypothetical protein
VDIPLVAIEAPPREFGMLLRRHWDAGDAVLPLPYPAVAKTAPVAERGPGGPPPPERSWSGSTAPGAVPTHTEPAIRYGPAARIPEGTALVVATSGSTVWPRASCSPTRPWVVDHAPASPASRPVTFSAGRSRFRRITSPGCWCCCAHGRCGSERMIVVDDDATLARAVGAGHLARADPARRP